MIVFVCLTPPLWPLYVVSGRLAQNLLSKHSHAVRSCGLRVSVEALFGVLSVRLAANALAWFAPGACSCNQRANTALLVPSLNTGQLH